MPIRQHIDEGRVPVKVYTGEIEPQARAQLVNISKLPIVHHHVAAMPDVHLGIGATVGSVIPTRQAIIPAAVGVDIGCGMMAARLSLTANEIDESSLRKVFNPSRHLFCGSSEVTLSKTRRRRETVLHAEVMKRSLMRFISTTQRGR